MRLDSHPELNSGLGAGRQVTSTTVAATILADRFTTWSRILHIIVLSRTVAFMPEKEGDDSRTRSLGEQHHIEWSGAPSFLRHSYYLLTEHRDLAGSAGSVARYLLPGHPKSTPWSSQLTHESSS